MVVRTLFVAIVQLALGADADAQVADSTRYEVHVIKHTLFLCNDTAYALTRIVDNDNSLGFRRGFLEADSFFINGMETVGLVRVVRFERQPGVDTLRSPFDQKIFPAPVQRVHDDYVSTIEDLLAEYACHAYLLRACGITELDTARVYYAGPVPRPGGTIVGHYEICRIGNWRQGEPVFQYYRGSCSPENGFRITSQGILQVPPKELKRLRKQLEIFVKGDWSDCLQPGSAQTDLLTAAGRRVLFNNDYPCQRRKIRSPYAIGSIVTLLDKYSGR